MGKKLFLISLVITIILIFAIAAVPAECRCSYMGKDYDSQYDDESTVITTSEQESISIEIETAAETETVEETYVEETRLEEFMLDFVPEESGVIIGGMKAIPLTKEKVFYVCEIAQMLSRSFLSFDISMLQGLEKGTVIEDVELDLLNGSSGDPFDPFSYYDSIAIETVNYGKRPLTMEDFNLAGFPVGFSTGPDIKLNTKELKDEFQKRIDNGEERFQIGLQFNGPKAENIPPELGVSWEFIDVSLKVRF